jgi:hypothetical protein
MRLKKGQFILIAACAVWALMVGVGLGMLWAYENAPGPVVSPPSLWPADSRIQPAADRATLIMLAHPHCPCTRASVGELSRLMTQTKDRVTAYVLFFKPPGSPDDWEKTDLWQSAASIPGVNVVADDGGAEAQRFQAVTSGQTALYDTQGSLLFSGGITGSRGHFGDNAGRSAIVSLLNNGKAERSETFAFGCPIVGADSECQGTLDERTNR